MLVLFRERSARAPLRQERDALIASSHGCAAFWPAARTSGGCFCTKASSGRSLTPPALATICHLIASTGSACSPRPMARTLASRFCATGLPLRAAFFSKCRGRRLVPGDAAAVEQRDGVLDLGVDVVGGRCRREQPRGFVHVLGHAAAVLVERGEHVLRFRAPGLRGAAEQFGRAREILRKQLALEIEQAEVVGGGDMPELGGGGEQLGGLLAVDGAGASG